MNMEILPAAFYEGMDATHIAKQLLGKIIATSYGSQVCEGIIVETEAYMAPDDLACHARGNNRTPRTETMFASPGTAYVYKCYGIHDLFNVVTGPADVAHAVLIRAVEPVKGIEIMKSRRNLPEKSITLTNGPGKLTKAMGITVDDDGINLTDPESQIGIFRPTIENGFQIISGPRVGMSHHTKHCGYYPWRYRIKGNKWTSKPDVVKYNW